MINDITAPAPRFILRLICIDEMLRRFVNQNVPARNASEIGPGLGDTASFLLSSDLTTSISLFEGSKEASKLLKTRFSNDQRISIHNVFNENSVTNSKFDLTVCCEVIEHIENDLEFMQLIAASMDEDGIFVGSMPAFMKKWQSVDRLAGHFRRYERDELEQKLQSAGFEVCEIRCYGFPLINLLYPIREYYYSKQVKKNQNSSKSEATARSGIARGFTKKFNKRFVYSVTRFFARLQNLPVLSEYGDGFVFVARKKTESASKHRV